MVKKAKKVLSLVLIFSLLMSVFSMSAYAEDIPDESNVSKNRIAQAVPKADDVTTVGAGNGITMKLFDYGYDVNDNGLDGYFEFRGACTDNKLTGETDLNGNEIWEHADYNKIWDGDGFKHTKVKVKSDLESGYPVLDLARAREAGSDKEDTSLGFLFGAGGKGVTGYNAVNTLLQYDENSGYYSYDSRHNAVDYDIPNSMFYVRSSVERGSSSTTYASTGTAFGDFFPFTYLKDNPTLHTSNGFDYHYESLTDVNYWFGMTMETTFWMPENGTFKGQPMIFEFSGDDDVWVFIDNKLALDLGGTHGVVDGSINFSTGEIQQYLNWQGTDKDDTVEGLKAEYMAADQNLSEADAEAKAIANATSFPTTLEERGITLDPNVEHTD